MAWLCNGAVLSAIRKAKATGQPAPEVPPVEASQGHVYIVHRLHTADAEDAWLQREWGEVMLSEDRLADAAVHFEACASHLSRLHIIPLCTGSAIVY